ncbi:hypothetical protein KFL_000690250 [Klebsormidium nitens]|uniref:Uncharacterized protein n=1 Tax=Klebsormidium nitens TaxID=105231 RepID=A0A1Y1HWY7_KLENI|nr:hypothetical protein KFL_000690250 [Klebsormidium nitens]|eukprot:GAQ81047.1 hypothetical protein KFL_000690250 [Klebsormidium nitens]
MAGAKVGAKAEAVVDVRRTLKFIGRLAVRLQADTEASTEPQALEEALQQVVSNLPDGVVRQTLESDLDRFGRALLDRVASLRSAKDKGPVEQDAGQLDLDGLAAGELVGEAGYHAAVDTLLSRWGEVLDESVGDGAKWQVGELENWRELSLKVLAARPSLPETLAAAYVNVEIAIWKEANGGGGHDSMGEASAKISAAEAVTSSVLFSSAFLSPESRLVLLSPLATLLSITITSLVRSAAELQITSAAKRLQKLARILVTVHSSHLKQCALPPAGASRTGAVLVVGLVVTRYLFLTSRLEGELGDAGLTKLQQTAAEAQAGLAAGERGALVELLCEPEELEAVQNLDKEGGYAVRGALYEAAVRVVPFEEVDATLGGSLRRVELARKAVALLRSNGDRSRASAILTAVLDAGGHLKIAAASKAQLERLRAVLPSEGLLTDPRGLTTWLVNSASDSAFSAARAALQSDGDTDIPSADRPSEAVPQASPAKAEDETLFYIDKTGSGAATDPAESRLIAAVEQIAQAGPSKSTTRSGRKGPRAQNGNNAGDESERSEENEESDLDRSGLEGESDDEKRPAEELGRADSDESSEDEDDDPDEDERPRKKRLTAELVEKASAEKHGEAEPAAQSEGPQAHGESDGEKRPQEELERAGSDEGSEEGDDESREDSDADEDERPRKKLVMARVDEKVVEENTAEVRPDAQSERGQAQAEDGEEESGEGDSDEGRSLDDDNPSDGDDSSDDGLDENAFIARMPFGPLDESSESETEEGRKRQKEEKLVPLPVPVGIPIPGPNDPYYTRVDGKSPAAETRRNDGVSGQEAPSVGTKKKGLKSGGAAEEKSGGTPAAGKVQPVKVGLKKKGAKGAEAEDGISPLHTRSGRTVVMSPGPGSVSKKTPGGAGRKKAGLSAVAEQGGADEAGDALVGEQKPIRKKGEVEEAVDAGGEDETAKVGGSDAGGTEREPAMAQKGGDSTKLKAPMPSSVKKGQKGDDAIAAQEEGAEDYVSPLHTRSGRIVGPPSTVKKTVKKKKGALDGVLEEGRERDVSPLHTRSGKAIGMVTPAPKTAVKSRAVATPVAGASTVKRSKKQ